MAISTGFWPALTWISWKNAVAQFSKASNESGTWFGPFILLDSLVSTFDRCRQLSSLYLFLFFVISPSIFCNFSFFVTSFSFYLGFLHFPSPSLLQIQENSLYRSNFPHFLPLWAEKPSMICANFNKITSLTLCLRPTDFFNESKLYEYCYRLSLTVTIVP